MMSRHFNCLLDETSEIIISVQILVTLCWTRRPLKFYCYRCKQVIVVQEDSLSGVEASYKVPEAYKDMLYIVMD